MRYFEMTPLQRKRARLEAMSGWFDPAQPNILCTDVERYLRAHRCFYFLYMRPAACNAHIYYRAEPGHKYDMLRAAMGPPVVAGQATKVACHAPRETAKTTILLIERFVFISLIRPRTTLILTERTDAMSRKMLRQIRDQFVSNDLIRRDFGGVGTLYPLKASELNPWNRRVITLMTTRSEISYISVNQLDHRGNRAHVAMIDDIEDDRTVMQQNFRPRFFRWLLKSYAPIVLDGGSLVWTNTRISDNSAMAVMLEGKTVNEEGEDPKYDPRLEDWYKLRFKTFNVAADGTESTVWPEKLSIAGYKQALARDPLTTLTEQQGESCAEGMFVLTRHETRHGYLRYKDRDTGIEMFRDLFTNETMPWSRFLQGLRRFGGGDIANSVGPFGSASCVLIIGVDKKGVIFVLDCLVQRVHADVLGISARNMGRQWNCPAIGWGDSATQGAIIRLWNYMREDDVSDPVNIAVTEKRGKKHERASRTLKGLFTWNKIRLPHTDGWDVEGVPIKPVEHPNRTSIDMLKHQIDTQTDEENPGRSDDAVDALEIACWIATTTKGVEVSNEDLTTKQLLEKMDKEGRPVVRKTVPMEDWPDSWIESAARVRREAVGIGMDPYDGM